MTPEEVPQDLVDAATFAFAAKAQVDGNTGFIDYARTMLAAVLLLHERQVRGAVAGELEQHAHRAAVADVDGPECVEARTWTAAAEVARGPR